MKLTPLQKRAERRARNQSHVDMNLVALIDIFTILIFFLLSSATGVEILPSHKAVKLPYSTAEAAPHETVVVTVSAEDILVDGRVVATVDEVMAAEGDLIAPLQAELERLRTQRKVIREENEAASRAVTVMGDRQIPYRLLRKVMYTAARADFTDVSFAVIRKYEAS
ncbi:biopolymer transporter ExbD [Caldimonas thermodepolymerans]|jgi:biopolymer transport protein TolR|uniref:Biopolymer transport protein ExbD n=1 Tax=Caldimonas thermodepolymerans TaxID=215580 RepID=A0A2S5T0C9_9BURK|nr:biopolymer transporter ExbD [Caldimonas thermodepolymerans]PPE68430.1 biopolymer transporter ExbD [Caldimonas thermodepolymerans]QPC30189.1 biopolymer transporter ExbD [Caldimonas thermodepolymerans]RDI00572.1 biopolymer transport protein ExbD [Caldimonas thermodepolymerans]TCP07149.1 biopolymer transport protein ExbD [Caldimonas thermodepolymerans]UZG42945.1 biopolymer transporter ExbD [Caldimonas thermodepolymerans]